MNLNRALPRILLIAGLPVLLVLTVSCGGSSSPTAPQGSAMIALTSMGVSPASMTVGQGAMITFVNNDTVNHEIASAQCPELNGPMLSPGMSFTARMAGIPETCTFHDAMASASMAFQGTITVTTGGTGTGGY